MGLDSDFGVVLGWIFSIAGIFGILGILYFLWISFHESQYKNLIDKSRADKPSSKVKTAIAFIVIVWALGFLIFNGE